MLPIEKILGITHLVTHDKCPDGMATAMIIRDALPRVKVTFLSYNTKAHNELPAEPGMLFCDFTPPQNRVAEFVAAGAICMDHHAKAEDLVKSFGALGVFAHEKRDPGISGASLAYREIWLPIAQANRDFRSTAEAAKVQDFAELAGIRDTWQRQDPRWDEACAQSAALTFWPEQEMLDTPLKSWAQKLCVGQMLYQRGLDHAKRSSDNSVRFVTAKGTRCAVFQGTKQTSDAAEYLEDSVDIIIGYASFNEDDNPVTVFSLRSHTNYDVGALCKAHGGGGHSAAAGFTFKMTPAPLSWWKRFMGKILPTPPGHVAVRPEKLHPYYLAEYLIRKYEGEE